MTCIMHSAKYLQNSYIRIAKCSKDEVFLLLTKSAQNFQQFSLIAKVQPTENPFNRQGDLRKWSEKRKKNTPKNINKKRS